MGVFSALATAGASVAGSIIGANATEDAADAQLEGNTAAIAEQRAAREAAAARFDEVNEQFKPFVEAGTSGVNLLREFLTGGRGVEDFEELSPGFNFRKREGEAALENAQRAKGLSLSGNALNEFQERGQGQASSEFDAFMRRLFGLTEVGKSAAFGVASTAGADIASGAATSSNIANILSNSGTTAANAEIAGAGQIIGGINTGVNNLLQLQQNQQLLAALGSGGGA